MFGRNKYTIPVIVFRQSPDGFSLTRTGAKFIIKSGNRRLLLRSGLRINAESTSKVGDTYLVFTPDEKVYFPVKINILGADVIQKIRKYENEHLNDIKKLEENESLNIDQKDQKKREMLTAALSTDEKNLMEKYNISFDILPDQTAYEVLQQEIEEANKIKYEKKQTKLDKMMPIILVVGFAIAFAIMAYATANYSASISSSAGKITTSMSSIATALHSVLISLGGSHVANTTIPAP